MKEHLKEFFEDVRTRCPGSEILTGEEDRLVFSHGCYPREYKWNLQGKYPYLAGGVIRPSSAGEI